MDHDYEGNGGPCTALVDKYNPNKKHDYPHFEGDQRCLRCGTIVKYESYGPGWGRNYCECIGDYKSKNWVCAEDGADYMDEIHADRTLQPCGSPSYSVLHPPFGHFCFEMEQGWDCMHFES